MFHYVDAVSHPFSICSITQGELTFLKMALKQNLEVLARPAEKCSSAPIIHGKVAVRPGEGVVWRRKKFTCFM
jgi:hypothetical protein